MAKIQDEVVLNSIIDYSNEIVTLKDFVTAVRKLPGMYLTGIHERGFLGMLREVLQNAFDELNRGAIRKSPCNHVWVYFEQGTNICSIEDNGRGIPFIKMLEIITNPHTSSNYEKEPYNYTAGKNGVGIKITNALSTWFTLESFILGEGKKVEFIEGYPSDKGLQDIENDNRQGTRVSFQPNTDVMGTINVSIQDIINLLELLYPLTPIGSIIDFKGKDLNGNVVSHKFVSEDGIITYLVKMTISPLIKPIVFADDNGTMKAEIAFTYDSQDLQAENLIGFGNYCYTSKGTHLRGFQDGLCKYFRDYMNKIFLNNSKLNVIDSDIKTGLKAAVSVAHLYPEFIGQDKDELDNNDLYPFVRNLTIKSLEQWSKNNPSDLQKLCKYFKDIAEVRVKSDQEKVKISKTYKASVLSGLPAKYVKPNGKTNLELIICEGDSALGSARNTRCKLRQGLFPIRGKLPNAFTTKKQEFIDNEEINGILALVNGGYGKSFDINKVPWEKIILMADADKDGCHINNLLLKAFLLYMRPIIEHGRLYRAVPPLYGAKKNGKNIYFTDRLDFITYTQKTFVKNNTIKNINNKPLTELEIIELLFRNIDYTYEIEKISNRYAINATLLELICININNPSLFDIIKKNYRFIDIEKQSNTIVIKGLIDSKYQTIFLNEQFMYDIKEIINIVDTNPVKYYNLNDNQVSIYTLMKVFEKNKLDVTRYKGLGEMNPSQLAESTLHPDSNRTLIRYTLEDAVKEIETIRYLESNRYELIRDAKASRADILG